MTEEKNKIPIKPRDNKVPAPIAGAGGNFQNPMNTNLRAFGGGNRLDKKKETDPAVEAELKAFEKNRPKK